mgnify:CR=1 FL=1
MLQTAGPVAQAAPFAYITNQGSHDVSVIDLAGPRVVATIPVGQAPAGVVAGPRGEVFVANAALSLAAQGATPATNIGPVLVGALVWGIGLSLGGTTGYAINPARDLGPRLAHALLPIAGKGGSDWSYAWIPVVGPMIGASLAAYAFATLSR